MSWWSFTFRRHRHHQPGRPHRADLLRDASAALFVLLLAAWLTVAIRTVRDGARGHLFLPAAVPASRPPASRRGQ